MGKASAAEKRKESYGNRNLHGLEAFQARKTGGMNLSERVWNLTEQFKGEMEMALDVGIGEGRSAAQLSRDVRGYLNEPNRLFRRVQDKWGNLVLSQNAKNYHPGPGVYRSSYKNAIRMTGTETNMAYRTSDHERWNMLDFVVGVEVRLSDNHTLNGRPFTDICDYLAGKYPKDFKFIGWHPQCRCYAIPILKTTDEMFSDAPSENEVKDMPENFKKWVEANAE
jgi:hypothetical protein